MAEIGAFGYLNYGGDSALKNVLSIISQSGGYTYPMPDEHNAICFRFLATSTKDIKAVKINWSTVTTPGSVDVRVETIDATTGKPTGTLYDSPTNYATKSDTPAAGWQTFQFASTPTAGLTVGTEYGIVVITETAGTAHTLRSHTLTSSVPVITLTAADGSTRANFAEVSSTTPICTLVFDDDTEESVGMCPFATKSTVFAIYGADRWAGSLFSVPSGLQIKVRGVAIGIVTGGGTIGSRGDLRIRILDSSNVEQISRTLDRDSLQKLVSTSLGVFFDPITLAAGSYRVVLDSSGSTVTDYWSLSGAQAAASKFIPSTCYWTSCTDGSTGPTWSNDATILTTIQLLLDDISATAAASESFTGTLINRGIN